LLAHWIGDRLRDVLIEKNGAAPLVVRIEVEESFGQSATCELRGE
jgi:hypothetical protein